MSDAQSNDLRVDCPSPPQMARWLRETATNTRLKRKSPYLTDAEVNLSGHVAFRLEQAANQLDQLCATDGHCKVCECDDCKRYWYELTRFPAHRPALRGVEVNMPEGARRTQCRECGWTYGTHAEDCESQSYAKAALDQMRLKLQGGPCWLIECGSPLVRYYCGKKGDWCDNPEHAHRFATEEQAGEVSRHMNTVEDRRVVKHIW